jgi:hypothetical protein
MVMRNLSFRVRGDLEVWPRAGWVPADSAADVKPGVVCGEFHLSQNASDGGHVAE